MASRFAPGSERAGGRRFTVLVSDAMSAEGPRVLEQTPEIECVVQTAWRPGELRERIRGVHGLLVRSATRVDAGLLAAADALKVVGRAGTGVDNVDIAAASRRGVVVMNTPGGNTVTTAEHALAMMMALARKIPQATASMRAGRWEKGLFKGVELSEKTLGLVGLGNIGSQVARRAAGLGMTVIAFDPHIASERAAALGVELVELDDLLARADFVSLHVPLTEQTRNLLRAETFARLKPGARVVNCSRGGVVHEADLVEAIRAGRVAGAALDVFEHEPLDPSSPLLGMEEIILTPHLGASTEEAQVKVATEAARQVADYLLRGVVRNAVNLPPLDPETLAVVGPFLDLASRIGLVLGQLADGRMEELGVEYRGEVAGLDTRPVTMTLVEGVLRPVLGDTVNIVNALPTARERGLTVRETATTEAGDYTSLLTVTLATDAGSHRVEGTLFARRDPRIVRLDGYGLELLPEGHLLVFANEDRPGVIGRVGTILGDNAVNIGGMQLGRMRQHADALAVLTVDSEIPEGVMAQIRALPFIRHARQIRV